MIKYAALRIFLLISLKAIFVISVLISSVIFTPSYSFAQSNQNENPLSSLFEILRQIFSFEERQSDSVPEFRDATVVQTSSTSSTVENIIPTANAGPDQTVLEFTNVTLDGSSSTDVDGSIQSYLWTQVSDPPVKLSSTSISNPTFEAPGVDSDDIVLRFSLDVTDDFGDTSTDQVDITITNVHSSPTANAGPDQTVLEFTNVTLDGSSSTDTNGDVKLFEWSQTDGPHVTLSSSTNINPTFTAPETDSNFILIFNLKVTDNDGDMDDDNVNVTVKDNNDDNNNDDNNNDDNNNDDNNNDDNNNDDNNNDDNNNDDNNNDDNNNDDNNNDDNNNDDNNNDDNNNDDNNNKDNDDDKNKVTICHRPPGNPNNSHTIRIGDSAANAHLKHGDTFGACNDSDHNDDDHNDDDHNDENKNGNSDVDNSKVNNSGKDKNDNDTDNPGKGNKNNDDENEDDD